MLTDTIRVVPEADLDICGVCGAYAELDDTYKIICAPCLADYKRETAIYDNTTILEHLAMQAAWHECSTTGQRIAHLRAQIKLYLLDERDTEAEQIVLQEHVADSDWTFADGHNELFESYDELEQNLDSLQSELDDIYRRLGDAEAELEAIYPTLPYVQSIRS